MEHYQPETYGDRIADLYDDWHDRTDTPATVEWLAALAGDGPILELAVGHAGYPEAAGRSFLWARDLAAHQCVQGDLAFAVPKDSQPVSVYYHYLGGQLTLG